ncbi:MAG: ATP synthase F1 subunit epsilon [Eubacterium sp.]|nr:ATP synthase F1 subunit epsilon [Eubacterium sp.]
MSEFIKIKIITPERVLFEGEVEKYTVKSSGEVGDFDVLPGHVSRATTFVLGRIKLYLTDGSEKEATLFGGFNLIDGDSATIMTEVAECPEEIDLERAEQAKARAEERLNQADMDYARAHAALLRAVERIDIYKNKN